jgi:hypothetical protein
MGHAVPEQHPAVVLRSRYQHLRSLLVVTLIAVVSLSATVVVVATDDDGGSGGTSSTAQFQPIHYGGYNPATGAPQSAPLPQRDALQDRTGAAASRPDESAVAAFIAGH